MKIIGRICKIACFVLLFGVIGFLLVRIAMADYYPRPMKDLYKSENLAAACEEAGEVTIFRQNLRASYDNPNFALFMADHQYYCPAAGELQITLRYNNSTLRELAKDFGLADTPVPSLDLFSFSLVSNSGKEDAAGVAIPGASYVPTHVETDSRFMYQYIKLTFTGIPFDESVDWYRVEIAYTGDAEPTSVTAANRWPAMICVWEREMLPYDTTYTLQPKDFVS